MSEKHELAFANATVVDGTGKRAFVADVAVGGGRISSVSGPNTLDAERVVDARGLVLAPGFIDIHSHADFPILLDGRAHSAVTQGVTTIVPGNCGHGVAPFSEAGGVLQADMSGGQRPEWTAELGDYSDFATYLESIRSRGVGVNVLPLVAHGVLRASVSGFDTRELTREEIKTMVGLTADAMDAGAVGLSSGLEYSPGIAASTEELRAVAMPVGARGGFYATHCRNRSDRIVEAAEEAVSIAEGSGSRLQMSHFVRRPTGPLKDLALEAQSVIRAMDSRGIAARFDVFPFEYGPSPLAMFVPQKFRAEAGSEFGARLNDSTFFERILADLDPRFVQMLEQGIAEDMWVSEDGNGNEFAGRSLGDIAGAWRTPVAVAVLKLMARAGENFHDVMINERWADYADLVEAIADPDYILMGDGSVANLDGPLEGRGFAVADWGHATRALGEFVREKNVLTLEDAVRRMTTAPAAQIGLEGRGAIKVGYAADLVLFDPNTVGNAATADAVTAVSTGIVEVLVNGTPVVSSGKVTDAVPGRVGLNEVNAVA